MDTELFEKLLSLFSVRVESIEVEKKIIRVKCLLREHKSCCPLCTKVVTKVHQYSTREIRDLDISGRHVILVIRVAQLVCEDCNRFFNEALDFAQANKSHTNRQLFHPYSKKCTNSKPSCKIFLTKTLILTQQFKK